MFSKSDSVLLLCWLEALLQEVVKLRGVQVWKVTVVINMRRRLEIERVYVSPNHPLFFDPRLYGMTRNNFVTRAVKIKLRAWRMVSIEFPGDPV